MNAVRQKVTVQNGGKLELFVPELVEGTEAEVLILTDDFDPEDLADARDYLEAKTSAETPVSFAEAMTKLEAERA